MKSFVYAVVGALLAGSAAFAQTMSAGSGALLSTIPTRSMTVTDWYKQDVYDPNNNKIGKVDDVLVSADGHVNALIVGVGGFLGAGEKDVAVDFNNVKQNENNNNVRLTMNTTKDALKSAPGFKYDSQTTTWVPDNSSK
jgi:sporulation protein YlmC with PRC-barrel domain